MLRRAGIGWVAVAVAFITATTLDVHGQQARFSRTLSPLEFKQAGLQKLSSNQLAVLDAVVRQDARINGESAAGKPPAGLFTARLATDEAHAAGIDLFSRQERACLNVMVNRYEDAQRLERSAGSAIPSLDPDIGYPTLEVHGMISLTYGAGAGGYHEMSGAVAVSIDDPAHGVSLYLGYGESSGRGPWPGRCWGWQSPDRFSPGGRLGP